MKHCMLLLLLSLPATTHGQSPQRDTSSPVAATPPLPITRYRVSFEHPEDGDTIHHPLGHLDLLAALDPIPTQYQLELWLDGRAVARISNHTNVVLENLAEKRYRAFLRLLDNNGKILASSQPITFYLHRTEFD